MTILNYFVERRQLHKFSSSMTELIHSIHPDAQFKINCKMVEKGKGELSIETDDDRAAACFVLFQEAMKLDENDDVLR